MLEIPTLLVHAWTPTKQADGTIVWTRPIADVAGRPLGFVRLAGDAGGSWFSWLRRQRLDVFETQDASFLMSLTKTWGVLGVWEIDDADERRVGAVYTKTIITSENQCVGTLDRDLGECGRILDPDRRILAIFSTKTPVILEVTFAEESSANPFVRMLLLGAVLTLDPAPRA